jgi:sugar O-acyltransferase (sialic acid O-acetyltransferase NeuD family)
MKPLVIWGAGGHAREVNYLCERLGRTVLGFLDERPHMRGVIVDDLPIFGDLSDLDSRPNQVEIVCAGVGDPILKRKFHDKTVRLGFALAQPLIHPNVHVSTRNMIAPGTVICEGVTMTVNINLGHCVIVNRGTTIGHDAVIADFATLSPSVSISGNVHIGEGVYIGTNAAIREKVSVGSWSVIGGSAFVTNDIPPHTLYAGVPAVFKKNLEP